MSTDGPVLVIEDDADVRQLLAERVRDDGYPTVEAVNGEQALALAAEARPCLVLLDLQLPGITGWEVLQHFRTEQGLREIPVVVVSILDETRAHPIVDGYLTKPFHAAQVHQLVTKLAGTKREVTQ